VPIEKGEAWGRPGELPVHAPVLSSDAALATALGDPRKVVGLEQGDVARTLGIRAPYDRSGDKHLVPIDAIHLEFADGSSHIAVAHAVVGNLRLSARAVALMNAAFIGTRNIAPRAHPGDGKVDVIELTLSAGDRIKAWRRMTTASHLPHPGISVARRAHGEIEFSRATAVRVDGVAVGRTSRLRYQVMPEAIIVAVS